jgi:hypothetical protein
MFIEDLIQRLAGDGQWLFIEPVLHLHHMDSKVVHSLSMQTVTGCGFTEKQANLAVKLIKKYQNSLSSALKIDISDSIENPQYKLPIRVLLKNKTITIKKKEIGNQQVISVSFPYDEGLVQNIRKYKEFFSKESSNGQTINWNPESKSWDFNLREEHISWVASNLMDSSFYADDKFLDLLTQIQEIEKSIENYVPMVNFKDDKFIFTNVSKNIPQPDSLDVVEVLMQAKKYGINLWADEIGEVLENIDITPVTKKCVTTPFGKDIEIDGKEVEFKDLLNTLGYNSPTLIVIPGGMELKYLRYCIRTLMKYGVPTEDMSVLFRLDGPTGKTANEIIKDSKVNNPISEKIKFFFVSGRIPKPLIESKIEISSVLNFGLSGVHYTLSNYLKNHHFVVNYKIKESDFAVL